MIECGWKADGSLPFRRRAAVIGSLCAVMYGTVFIRAAAVRQTSCLGYCGQVAWHPKRQHQWSMELPMVYKTMNVRVLSPAQLNFKFPTTDLHTTPRHYFASCSNSPRLLVAPFVDLHHA
jgi:hypothetical protein